MRQLMFAIAATALFPAAASAVTIANPSFENFQAGFDPGGGFTTLSGSGLPGWTIDNGSIDHIGGYWTAQNGARSIDLDGNAPASISQTIGGLSAGTEYIVSFFVSANPDNRDVLTRTATLSFGSASNLVSYTLTAGNSRSNMLWQQASYSFIADGPTALLKLASNSASGSFFGLAVDNFAISAAPEPSSWAMLILGFGIAGGAIRRSRAVRTPVLT